MTLHKKTIEEFEKITDEYGQLHEENCDLYTEDGSYDGCNCAMRNLVGELAVLSGTYAQSEYQRGKGDERKKHFKEVNSILNKYSKPIQEGGLDYVKAFEEMEKYEHKLFQARNK